MKQYKITSSDFLNTGTDQTIPDAVLSPEDTEYVKTFLNTNITNGVVAHLKQVVQSKQDQSNCTITSQANSL